MKKIQQTGFWKATPLVTSTNLNLFGWGQNQARLVNMMRKTMPWKKLCRNFEKVSLLQHLMGFVNIYWPSFTNTKSAERSIFFVKENVRLKALFKIIWLNFFLSFIFSEETWFCKSAGKGGGKFSKKIRFFIVDNIWKKTAGDCETGNKQFVSPFFEMKIELPKK